MFLCCQTPLEPIRIVLLISVERLERHPRQVVNMCEG